MTAVREVLSDLRDCWVLPRRADYQAAVDVCNSKHEESPNRVTVLWSSEVGLVGCRWTHRTSRRDITVDDAELGPDWRKVLSEGDLAEFGSEPLMWFQSEHDQRLRDVAKLKLGNGLDASVDWVRWSDRLDRRVARLLRERVMLQWGDVVGACAFAASCALVVGFGFGLLLGGQA